MEDFYKILGAKNVPMESVKGKKGIAHLVTAKKVSESELGEFKQQTKSRMDRVTVIIDGVPQEWYRETIQRLVAAGRLVVVWPGTNVPVGHGESKGGYPPDWLGDHIP